MNGIIGALSLLKRSTMEDNQRELVDIANQSSSAMIKTVDDILTFTELMSGEPKLIISSFTQNEWTSDLIKVAEKRCQEAQLNFAFHSDINNILLVNDKNKLISVCRNLLENAVKYTVTGSVSFNISHTLSEVPAAPDSPQKDGILTVRIEDNGPGLSEEFLSNIFKPFRQAEGGFKRTYQGMGIGLAMSNVIVSSLGGKLRLQNREEGTGTIAQFTIPSGFIAPPPTALSANTTMTPKTDINTAPKTPNILIVEDNKVNQLVLSKLVKQMNCTILLANNGEEGVEQVQKNHIDLILMDCQMPIMDGFEATEAIRKLTSTKRGIPIVAVTANARDADKARCFEVGMNGFLSKPVDFKSVRQAIDEQLSKSSASPVAVKPHSPTLH